MFWSCGAFLEYRTKLEVRALILRAPRIRLTDRGLRPSFGRDGWAQYAVAGGSDNNLGVKGWYIDYCSIEVVVCIIIMVGQGLTVVFIVCLRRQR